MQLCEPLAMKEHTRCYLTAKICSNTIMPFSTSGMINSFLLLLHDIYTKIHIGFKVATTGALPLNNTKAHISMSLKKKLPQSACLRWIIFH